MNRMNEAFARLQGACESYRIDRDRLALQVERQAEELRHLKEELANFQTDNDIYREGWLDCQIAVQSSLEAMQEPHSPQCGRWEVGSEDP